MKYVLLGYLALAMFACRADSERFDSATAQPHQKNGGASQNSGVTSQHLKGLYFGVSDDQLGRRAWLLRLDTQTSTGRLYMPPNNLDLSHVDVSSTGGLTFRSDVGVGDIAYGFEGQVTPFGIRGTFHTAQTAG